MRRRALFRCRADGFIGYLWDDSWKIGHHHQGIDIFSGKKPGETEIHAAVDGYLSRPGGLEIFSDHPRTG